MTGPGRAVPEAHKAQPAQVNGQSSQPETSAQRAQAQPAQRAKRPQPEQHQQAPPVQKSPSNQQTQQHKPQQEKQQPQNTKQPPQQQRALQEALPPGEQPETDTTAARPKQKRAKTAAKASALRVAEEGSKREASPAKTPRPSKIRAAKTMPRPSDAKQGPDNEGTAEAMAGYASGYAALAAACLEAAQEEEEEEAEAGCCFTSCLCQHAPGQQAQRRAELPAIKPIASKEEASPSQSVQAASVAGNLSQLLLSADGPQQCLGGALPQTAISPPTSALPVTSPAPTPLPPPPPPPPPPVHAELAQELAPAWPPQPLVMPMAVATAKTAPAFQKSEVAPITPSRLGLAAPVTPPKATAPERAPWRSGSLPCMLSEAAVACAHALDLQRHSLMVLACFGQGLCCCHRHLLDHLHFDRPLLPFCSAENCFFSLMSGAVYIAGQHGHEAWCPVCKPGFDTCQW